MGVWKTQNEYVNILEQEGNGQIRLGVQALFCSGKSTPAEGPPQRGNKDWMCDRLGNWAI